MWQPIQYARYWPRWLPWPPGVGAWSVNGALQLKQGAGAPAGILGNSLFILSRLQFNIDNPAARAVGRKADNGRALSLAQLAARTRHVVALCGRADDDRPTGRRRCVLRGSRRQHDHHWPGRVVGQPVGVGQVIRA